MNKFFVTILSSFIFLVFGQVAMAEDYLPITKDAYWTLRAEASEEPVVMRVLDVQGSNYRMGFENPWMDGEFKLSKTGSTHEIRGLTFGQDSFDIPPGIALYDFAAPKGTTWRTPMGTQTIVKKDESVRAHDGRLYTNCIVIRETDENGASKDWIFAPGVGYVGMKVSLILFKLDPASSRLPQIKKKHNQTAQEQAKDTSKDTYRSSQSKSARKIKPRGDRSLSIAITLDERNDFSAALETAKTAGMHESGGLLNFDWNLIEPKPGQYVDPEGGALGYANVLYPKHNMTVSLTIAPIQTNNVVVPPDLKGRAFDDPGVIRRFNQMLDYVFSQVPNLTIRAFSIGNEVDAVLGNDTQKWEAYRRFSIGARDHLRKTQPGLEIGVKTTFGGMTQLAPAQIKRLNADMDVVMVTYYPLDHKMRVRNPAEIHMDFAKLVNIYPEKPIYMLEAGYPSSPLIGSSEDMQAAFIRQIFKAWDVFGDHVQIIDFTWLNDLPPSVLDHMSDYYGSADKSFLAYLGTLGLRTFEGRDKPAFKALQEEAQKRGW